MEKQKQDEKEKIAQCPTYLVYTDKSLMLWDLGTRYSYHTQTALTLDGSQPLSERNSFALKFEEAGEEIRVLADNGLL